MQPLENRDPNKINEHVEIGWDDVFGEPYSVRSPEASWSMSKACFNYSRSCCYICLSVLCSPIMSCCCGLSFAMAQFQQIWCIGPELKLCSVGCSTVKKLVIMCCQTLVTPLAEAIGHVLSKINITSKTTKEDPRLKEPLIV
ncbi:caveolin-3-like [Rhynchophorus ferrugineus]|uniref:Caveolin n=1 Tax=Rhynchophorus ferrugineus TaxID=354439 RepID=A0A834IM39_RHYFE|nr:hypothetical protein GWI33_023376 [Rhynchophorus ferrugineus]